MIGEFHFVQKHESADFEASELWNVQSAEERNGERWRRRKKNDFPANFSLSRMNISPLVHPLESDTPYIKTTKVAIQFYFLAMHTERENVSLVKVWLDRISPIFTAPIPIGRRIYLIQKWRLTDFKAVNLHYVKSGIQRRACSRC